jgi:hypothetical protein
MALHERYSHYKLGPFRSTSAPPPKGTFKTYRNIAVFMCSHIPLVLMINSHNNYRIIGKHIVTCSK